jgi:GNAT superfamily N-acetyltransferase
MKLQLQSVIWDFPKGFEALREEARAEEYKHIERLFSEWQSGETKFDKDDELLLAAFVEGELAAVGGITQDTALKRTLRMRRFYVRPKFRRSGVGRKLAEALLADPRERGLAVVVNVGPKDAAAFWESLDFAPDGRDGHSHKLRGQ